MNTECSILNIQYKLFFKSLLKTSCVLKFMFYINLSCKLIIFMMLPQNGIVLFTGGRIE